MPIPSSSLRGHSALHNRVIAALERSEETKDVEFKRSAPWADLKDTIARSMAAMSNLRDGGIIVIGVAGRQGQWIREGVDNAHLESFDADDILTYANRCVAPAIVATIVKVELNGRIYIVIHTHEFLTIPVLVTKDSGIGFVRGELLCRTAGPPASCRVTTAEELREIIELATEKQVKRFLAVARRVGLGSDSRRSIYDEELGSL